MVTGRLGCPWLNHRSALASSANRMVWFGHQRPELFAHSGKPLVPIRRSGFAPEAEKHLECRRPRAIIELETKCIHPIHVARLFNGKDRARCWNRTCMSSDLDCTLKYSPKMLKFPNVPNASRVAAPFVTMTCTCPKTSNADQFFPPPNVQFDRQCIGQADHLLLRTPNSRGNCTVIFLGDFSYSRRISASIIRAKTRLCLKTQILADGTNSSGRRFQGISTDAPTPTHGRAVVSIRDLFQNEPPQPAARPPIPV